MYNFGGGGRYTRASPPPGVTYHISIFSKTKCKYPFISLGYQFLFHLGRVANLEHTRFRVSVLQVNSYLNPPMHFHQLPSWQSTTQLGLSVQTSKSLLQFPRKILAVCCTGFPLLLPPYMHSLFGSSKTSLSISCLKPSSQDACLCPRGHPGSTALT